MNALINLLRPLQFRGKARLLGWMVPHSGSVNARVFGYDIELDLVDHIQRLVYIGAYERELVQVFETWLHPGMTFLDVGANAGFFTLLAARAVGPSGRVIAVEPSPWVADRLSRTFERNRLSNAVLARMALGAAPGTLPLVEPLRGNHTPSLLDSAVDGRKRTDVQIARLDDCISGWIPNGSAVDVMKVDIEGFEPFLVEGGRRTLGAGRVKRIAIEANDGWLARANSSAGMLRDELERLGFRLVGTLDPGSGNETLLMEHA